MKEKGKEIISVYMKTHTPLSRGAVKMRKRPQSVRFTSRKYYIPRKYFCGNIKRSPYTELLL